MSDAWLLLAELGPRPDGYDTPEAVALMRRIQQAVERAGEPDEHARVRLVMGDGHTLMRFETCSPRILEEFRSGPAATPPR